MNHWLPEKSDINGVRTNGHPALVSSAKLDELVATILPMCCETFNDIFREQFEHLPEFR
jgi:hypothetical protein